MADISCPVCDHRLHVKHRLKHTVYKCNRCDLLHADAQFDHSFTSQVDETHREQGLKALRQENFEVIINQLKALFTSKQSALNGLEIGSGNGWWLEACSQAGITCKGVEPETIFADYHRQHNLQVIYGFYPHPQASTKEGYDFIIFNDVFEHIEKLEELTTAVKNDLAAGGYLIINLPMSDGIIYRVATLLARFGITSFLERMWQFNFHSPHINYFNTKNLDLFVAKRGFTKVAGLKLSSINLSTVKERIRTDKSVSNFKAGLLTIALWCMSPVIYFSKPDIKVFFYKKDK